MIQPQYPCPVLAGQYKNIYPPQAHTYLGIDTPLLRHGTRYDLWVANDFTMLRGRDGQWHAFGITYPRPPSFKNSYSFDEKEIHQGENQFFHVTFRESTLRQIYQKGGFDEHEHILYPHQRPNEMPPCWAPCAVEKDGRYFLFYSPGAIRAAVSDDLYNWTPEKVLFDGPPMTRDPYVYYENGMYHMIYLADELLCRTSPDLLQWSEPSVFQRNPFRSEVSQESPCIVKRDGIYYLLWCIYDGRNGCYDDRTFIFASESLDGLNCTAPIGMLRGHAPELLMQDGEWYIVSVFYPQNGLNIAPIAWI